MPYAPIGITGPVTNMSDTRNQLIKDESYILAHPEEDPDGKILKAIRESLDSIDKFEPLP